MTNHIDESGIPEGVRALWGAAEGAARLANADRPLQRWARRIQFTSGITLTAGVFTSLMASTPALESGSQWTLLGGATAFAASMVVRVGESAVHHLPRKIIIVKRDPYDSA